VVFGLTRLTNLVTELHAARNELAQAIQTTVKTVTDNYTNSRAMNRKEDLEQKFESLNREIVDQQLSGVRTICEKLMQTKEGTYKTYIAIELSSDDLVKKYNERMAADDKLKIDYDYSKFKETFDKEMEKMSGNEKFFVTIPEFLMIVPYKLN